MRILVACEFSGTVRDAFCARGHEAISCDLLPSEAPGSHYHGNVLDILECGWDMLIAFPPCTYLASSGNRWLIERPERRALQEKALDFVRTLLVAPIPRLALENPVGAISRYIRPPDQTIQPWEYGHGYTKRTCLWLKNLPYLQPTCLVADRRPTIHMMPARKSRARDRSRTPIGIATAMAAQWP